MLFFFMPACDTDCFSHFFFPLALVFDAAALDVFEATLDALDGDAEVALLPVADLTLSRALFCKVTC